MRYRRDPVMKNVRTTRLGGPRFWATGRDEEQGAVSLALALAPALPGMGLALVVAVAMAITVALGGGIGCQDQPPPRTAADTRSVPAPGPTERATSTESAGGPAAMESEPEVTDATIAMAVQRALRADPLIAEKRMYVAVRDGVVTLTGEANNLLARERAARITETIRGVAAVVNRVEVDPAVRPDKEIRDDVYGAIHENPALSAQKIKVAVKGGQVTLAGVVDSYARKDLAARAARSVRGVARVVNRLMIRDRERADAEIARDVKALLRADVLVDAGSVTVKVEDGRVVLGGFVTTAAQKTRAYFDAWVQGVKKVDMEKLTVSFPQAQAKAPRQAQVQTSEEARAALQRSLERDPRVESDDVTVMVTGGAAILSGKVPTLMAWFAAEEDARNTVGIFAVENKLAVQPERKGEPGVLAKAIANGFERSPYLFDEELTVNVSQDGVALLKGLTDSYMHKELAQDIASQVEGITGIRNEIRVKASPEPKPDVELLADLRKQLFWNSLIDASKLVIHVDQGRVKITGTVPTFRARREIREEAYAAGAEKVKMNVKVKPVSMTE